MGRAVIIQCEARKNGSPVLKVYDLKGGLVQESIEVPYHSVARLKVDGMEYAGFSGYYEGTFIPYVAYEFRIAS
jgi:hypothetical protein